jgi:hypothetical protein
MSARGQINCRKLPLKTDIWERSFPPNLRRRKSTPHAIATASPRDGVMLIPGEVPPAGTGSARYLRSANDISLQRRQLAAIRLPAPFTPRNRLDGGQNRVILTAA